MSYQGKVTASVLNVRSGPGTSYSIVGSYYNGTIVEIKEEQNNWGHTKDGWVSLDYISKIENLPITPLPSDPGVQGAIKALLDRARAEVGYLEKATNSQLDDKTANAGYNNWTKYARDMATLGAYNGNKNGYAWCDVFVDWCFFTEFGTAAAVKMLNQPLGGLGAGCTYSADYYRAAGRFTRSPQPGDQIFFTDDGGESCYHTGIVEAVDSHYVYTIEGNTSSAAGVVDNGGSVNQKSYSLSYYKIAGYGRPDWSLVADKYRPTPSVPSTPSTPTESEELTVEEFEKLLNNYLTTLAKQDASSWSKDAREWAEGAQFIQGDENGNKMYKKYLTREEMMTVLYRIFQRG